MAKPISETLKMFQGGDFNIKAGELFASVLRGVEDTGKAGKLTITLDVKQQNGAVAVLAKVTDDSAAAGYPTALQMLKMATEFVMNEERSLKSSVRLQSGGVRLTYVADPDKGTTEDMAMFEKFQIGIPVFHGGGAWAIEARLKYRNNSGKLSFHYELVRPDRVHQAAAEALIDQVRQGLGDVPMIFGACSSTRD